MKDFLRDIGFFLKKFYSKSTNKFLTIETNTKDTEIDVIEKIIFYFNEKELLNVKEGTGTVVIGLDLSKYANIKNLEELFCQLNEDYEQNIKTYCSNNNLHIIDIKYRYCYIHFSSYLTYNEAKNIFSLLNLSREYFIEKYISTVIILNNHNMNIFLNIAKDLFSWSQYNFMFNENQNVDNNYISKMNFAKISNSVKNLKKIEILENNYLSGSNKVNTAIELFFLYNQTKNYIKMEDKNIFLQSQENVPKEMKNYFWIIYYKNYSKSNKYIEDFLKNDIEIFNYEFFILKDFIIELKYSDAPKEVFYQLLYLIDSKLKEDSTFLCQSIFARTIIYLFINKEPKSILKSLYDYIEIVDECSNSKQELLESLFYIMNLEILYQNNYESVITLYSKYSEPILKELDNDDCIEVISSIFYLVSKAYVKLKDYKKALIVLDISKTLKEKYTLIDVELIKVYLDLTVIYFLTKINLNQLEEIFEKTHNAIKYINSNQEINLDILLLYINLISGYITCEYKQHARLLLDYVIKAINKKNNNLNEHDKISLILMSLFLVTKLDIEDFKKSYIEDTLNLIVSMNNIEDDFLEYQLKETYIYLLISVCEYFIEKKDSKNTLNIIKEIHYFISKHVDLKYMHLEKDFNKISIKIANFKHESKINSVISKINKYLSL